LIKSRNLLFNSLELPARLSRNSHKAGGFLSFCFKSKRKEIQFAPPLGRLLDKIKRTKIEKLNNLDKTPMQSIEVKLKLKFKN
jgi:hypothetical protein